MAKPMVFYRWMICNHISTEGAIGKLARDIMADSGQFTHGWSHHRNRAYLEAMHADASVLKAFEEAWVRYTEYKKGFANA